MVQAAQLLVETENNVFTVKLNVQIQNETSVSYAFEVLLVTTNICNMTPKLGNDMLGVGYEHSIPLSISFLFLAIIKRLLQMTFVDMK